MQKIRKLNNSDRNNAALNMRQWISDTLKIDRFSKNKDTEEHDSINSDC